MDGKGLKALFEEFLGSNRVKVENKMYFRLYDPQKEDIVRNYAKDDWQRIFPNMEENDLKDISTCANVVILIWCDKATYTPRGMVYFEENFYNRGEVLFHGGTWDHDKIYFKEIFRSLVELLDFILLHNKLLSTSCGLENRRADKFQKSLCFKEICRDETAIYKTLDKDMYNSSVFINKLRTIIV